MEELELFFRELEAQYAKERQEFVWNWGVFKEIASAKPKAPNGADMLSEMVHFIAYNLAKNVLHGPLPSHLHSRMILNTGEWCTRYAEFLEK